METPLAERMAKRLLFQGLTPTQLDTIAEMTRVRDVEDGEVVVHERDYGDTLHVIESGAVQIFVASPTGDRLVARLEAPRGDEVSYAGDFFGEMCLLDLEPRCATVTADGPCRLWELNRDDLYWLFGDDKELQLRILLTVARVLSRRLSLMDGGAAPDGRGG
ncbi:MAG: cyclic nucleotide-binding domain-containing protein [Planctomycetes bacterium]|nr:cyclic nucleotide-binding domain-containing protein [Planctomycetota bacterium]